MPSVRNSNSVNYGLPLSRTMSREEDQEEAGMSVCYRSPPFDSRSLSNNVKENRCCEQWRELSDCLVDIRDPVSG